MSNKNKSNIEVTGFTLHMLAMLFMLLDHMWITVVRGNDWLTCVGRLAFPIFAFLIVEGYMHTSNLKRYVGRMFIFALISEIPFNLVSGGSMIFPFHQNVLWTFLLSLLCMHLLEKVRKTENVWIQIIVSMMVIAGGYLLGNILMVDYHSAGIMTVLVFYFFRGNTLKYRLGQFLGLYWINFHMLGGVVYILEFATTQMSVPRQSFAMFALIPIWLYSGKRGITNVWIQRFYYAFYPLHLFVLSVFSRIL